MPNCGMCGENVPNEQHFMMAHAYEHQQLGPLMPLVAMADNLLKFAPHNVLLAASKGGFLGNPLIPGPL